MLDPNSRLPVPGQTVAIGNARAVTDAEGRFDVLGAPRPYDVVIVNPERSRVAVYTALTASQPVLVFGSDGQARPPLRASEISGTLVGGGEYPASDAIRIFFRGPSVSADLNLPGPGGPGTRGPTFGPLRVAWDGPEVITGTLFSRRGGTAKSPAASCVAATVPLRDGEPVNVTLEYKDAKVVHRPPVSLGYPASLVDMPSVYEEYRTPGSGTVLHGGTASLKDEYDSVDLASCGAILCTTVSAYSPYLRSRATACGAVTPSAVSLTLRPAPEFSTPPFRTRALVGLKFAWSKIPRAVYALTLADSKAATPAAPTIVVYTASHDAAWPELSALGVSFPQPIKAYGATVQAMGEYANLDEATGPRGFLWGTPERAFTSESQELSIPVELPWGKEEAKCQHPYGSAIVCGGLPDAGPVEGWHSGREDYMLDAINTKIRRFPAFAAASGIHCVRDCASARAFMKAYRVYVETHSGFEPNQPSEPTGPPPPPPPEFAERLRATIPNANAPKARSPRAGASDARTAPTQPR